MDGVITDFIRGYRELTGIDITGTFHDSSEFWKPIEKKGYDFWINLHWTKDGKKLWDYIKKYNPVVLSSPSRQNDSRVAKHDWIERELPGTHLILRTAENKKEFAAPDSILIDNLYKNIDNWEKAGGIAIHHKSADDTIKQLKKLSL